MGAMKKLFMQQVDHIMEGGIVETNSMAAVNDFATEIYQLFGENCMYRELAVGYDVSLLDEQYTNDPIGEWRKCDV